MKINNHDWATMLPSIGLKAKPQVVIVDCWFNVPRYEVYFLYVDLSLSQGIVVKNGRLLFLFFIQPRIMNNNKAWE